MNDYTEGHVRQNKSPNTQRTDCGLRTVKTDDNAESCAGCKEDFWDAMDGNVEGCNPDETSSCNGMTHVWGLQRWMVTPRVVLRKSKSQHAVDRFWYEGYEDKWQCQESCLTRTRVLICNKRLCRWLSPRHSSSTQWIDFSLKAIKVDDSTESRAGAKTKYMTHNYVEWCH